MTININQFAQTPVRGELDLQISKAGVLAGVVSANQVGTLTAGDFVILDSAITVGTSPQFIGATSGQLAIGQVIRTVKAATFAAGDEIQVAFFGGPVVWVVANEAITPGEQLESNANGNMQLLNANSMRGVALDPASGSGVLFRMILGCAPLIHV